MIRGGKYYGFWVTDSIKEVTTPKQPAFDVKEYTDARVKYGDAVADRMRRNGAFNLDKNKYN